MYLNKTVGKVGKDHTQNGKKKVKTLNKASETQMGHSHSAFLELSLLSSSSKRGSLRVEHIQSIHMV